MKELLSISALSLCFSATTLAIGILPVTKLQCSSPRNGFSLTGEFLAGQGGAASVNLMLKAGGQTVSLANGFWGMDRNDRVDSTIVTDLGVGVFTASIDRYKSKAGGDAQETIGLYALPTTVKRSGEGKFSFRAKAYVLSMTIPQEFNLSDVKCVAEESDPENGSPACPTCR